MIPWLLLLALFGGCARDAALPTHLAVPIPDGCPPAVWDDRRGCVETVPPGRITITDCCGRKQVKR